MAPKPFPYPLGVGVDICQIHRIAGFLKREEFRNRWARRIFTRLEWPELYKTFKKTNQKPPARAKKDLNRRTMGNDQRADMKALSNEGSMEDAYDVWMLPGLPNYSALLDEKDNNAYMAVIANENSPLGGLARHLAGRWAAKEATIKAHSHRRLYMQDISIVSPRLNPSLWPIDQAKRYKTVALIEPVCETVLIDERVASIRALRGFGPRSAHLHKGALIAHAEIDETMQHLSGGEAKPAQYYERRSKVKGTERQVAEVNISHDGNFAVAVCMALDQPGPEVEAQRIVDDGEGLPIHEPQWGDEGWLDRDLVREVEESKDQRSSEKAKQALGDFFENEKIPFLRE